MICGVGEVAAEGRVGHLRGVPVHPLLLVAAVVALPGTRLAVPPNDALRALLLGGLSVLAPGAVHPRIGTLSRLMSRLPAVEAHVAPRVEFTVASKLAFALPSSAGNAGVLRNHGADEPVLDIHG